STGVRASTIAPAGTLTKKIHDQLKALVSAPPSRTPAAAPLPEAAPHTPNARLRSRPSVNVVVRMDRAAGESNAAPSPWRARKPISEPSDQARPLRSEADGEEDESCGENAPTPEQVGEPPAEQQQAAEEDGVRGDDPLQALLAEVEVGLDRRQGDVHDCYVEDDHELGGHDQGQGKPSPSVLEGSHTALLSWKPNTHRFPAPTRLGPN